MAQMKVLISGAGITGNALAYWLSKLGHNVTVIERFPELRTTGLQVDLRGPGIQVLKRMGLEEAFRAKSVPEQGFAIVDSSNRRWAYFGVNNSGKGLQSFTTEYEILRGDLCRLMHDAIKDKVTFRFGVSIDGFKQKGNGVDVEFTDGKTERFDFIVGADGMGSNTRKLMLGPGVADALRPVKGAYTAYFTIPRPIQKGEEYNSTFYLATGRRAIMTRRHSPEEIQIYLPCNTLSDRMKQAHKDGVPEQKKALAEIFQDAGWKSKEILRDMFNSENFYCERLGLVKLDAWYDGRVVLVGDAAYCPSPLTGMGTTSGIVGAYVLAGEIARHCGNAKGGKAPTDGLDVAFKTYDDKFRPFINQVTDGVGDDSIFWNKMPSSAFAVALVNLLLGIAAFLRLNVVGNWILKENVKWMLPEYDELK
ncbi:FAD/NAD(P)-binding domain-containing protein [Trichoderma citrinoviride]|uniref:FAD/NAD(P)-binding domain-containing protein n=1 Tax=Trichoderma citrinoviride TaxID=58853 RepID=A0A2T4BBI2_9HYPO|nr:FAD/NAD(P)-binding domain-containing protein [Trichoderma citrinoviride]PTB66684.1 FAD/NAD(P)-binding domain-containing protein [Trichoderma citrinoviride]